MSGHRLPSFRARAIDIHTQLVIVRSADELTEEGTVTRVVHHGHQQLDRENEQARRARARTHTHAA
jgi:DNA-binding transcriptional regulator YhcF (GntR family)